MELFVIFSTKVFYDRSWDMRIWNSTMMALLFNFGTLLAWNLEFLTQFSFEESLIIVVPSWKNGCYSELYLQKTRRLHLEAPKKLDWYWLLSVFENELKRRLKMEWEIDFSAYFRMCFFNMNVDTIRQSNSWMNTFLAVLWFSCLLLLVAVKL